MKRIDDKVRDIVDVRSYGSVVDFSIDASQTVQSYHFTDITADLMAKWVNAVASVSDGRGSASALAGFRGVGKSHFLATLSGLLANSELRPRIQNALVESATQSLQRKNLSVAFVHRGVHDSLLAELKISLAPILGVASESLSDSIGELLLQASKRSVDGKLVIIIDTAFNRKARVSRDDGPVLAEIAETAKRLGFFVGIALDDDIAGADGANAGIATSFAIDYLDQEHLYKIVDTHIFPKAQRMLHVLHDIYNHYRSVMPGFRWSEQRFTSLYPLHPAIMEIAPFVRLYLHEFALLGFASEAGARIMGRPANSLIAPDEVFDNVEKSLRNVDELRDIFVAFDKLNTEVVAKTPVMKRLQAKLILKGLLLLSLNDDGATAAEIGASMLIFDETDPQEAVRAVESTLEAFAAAIPSTVEVTNDSSGSKRFAFRLTGKDDLRTALNEATKDVSESEIKATLKKLMGDRFGDCSFKPDESVGIEYSDSYVVWRGGNRPGRVYWANGNDGAVNDLTKVEDLDWFAGIVFGDSDDSIVDDHGILWEPAKMTADERSTLQRLIVLQRDTAIRTEFKDHLAAAVQAHSVAADKILGRLFLTDGVLSIEGFEYNFTDEARNAQSLAQIMTAMLESLFEGRFPMHPYFPQVIRMKEVSTLVADFFSGSKSGLDETQWLASTYALPLDLVQKENDKFVPIAADNLLRNSVLVQRVLRLMSPDNIQCQLSRVFEELAGNPYGLVREASYLLLAAMAAERMIEFVTESGDRINRRSFDLRIIWEDIVAISLPVAAVYANARLNWWASQLCDAKFGGGLESAENRDAIAQGLKGWLEKWDSQGAATLFEQRSDGQLNARIWRLATISIRSFSSVAEAVRSFVDKGGTLESCLERIADTFSDSETEFVARKNDLVTVIEFLMGSELRDSILDYLSFCEFTGDEVLDAKRVELFRALNSSFDGTINSSIAELEIKFQQYKREYSELYSNIHDMSVHARDVKDNFREIRNTAVWREFVQVSDLPIYSESNRASANSAARQLERLDCRFDVKEHSAKVGFCGCRFTLSSAEEVERLPNELWATLNSGLSELRTKLTSKREQIVAAISQGIDMSDADLVEGARRVRSTLLAGSAFGGFTDGEIRILKLAFERIGELERSGLASARPKEVVSPTPEWDATIEEIGSLLEAT